MNLFYLHLCKKKTSWSVRFELQIAVLEAVFRRQVQQLRL